MAFAPFPHGHAECRLELTGQVLGRVVVEIRRDAFDGIVGLGEPAFHLFEPATGEVGVGRIPGQPAEPGGEYAFGHERLCRHVGNGEPFRRVAFDAFRDFEKPSVG